VGGQCGGAAAAVTERLTAAGREKEAKLARLRAEAAAAAAENFTFAPRIDTGVTQAYVNARLERLEGSLPAGGSASAGGSAPPTSRFLSRQATLAAARAAELAAMEAAVGATAGCTFKPDIGNAEEVLALLRPARTLEPVESVVERLSSEGLARGASARAAGEAAFAAVHTFKPTLNPTSRALGRAHTVEELKDNEHGERVKLRAMALAEAEFAAVHTFKPKLLPSVTSHQGSFSNNGGGVPSISGGGGGSNSEPFIARVAESKGAMEARMEALRRQSEYAELAPCTFAPQTAASKASLARLKEAAAVDGGVVIVRGLGRHLELKELSRQMEAEKK